MFSISVAVTLVFTVAVDAPMIASSRSFSHFSLAMALLTTQLFKFTPIKFSVQTTTHILLFVATDLPTSYIFRIVGFKISHGLIERKRESKQ